MKLLLTLLFILPSLSFADDITNPLAGSYSTCVQWTSVGGVAASKKIELLYTPQRTLHLTVGFYVGSVNCQGDARDVARYENYKIVQDNDAGVYRHMTAQAQENGMYFEFVLTTLTAVIYTGDTAPVQHNALRMMILERPE